MRGALLDTDAMHLLAAGRRAVLTTIDARDGRPRSVPICYAIEVVGDRVVTLVTPLDEKPKSVDDPHELRRVRDLLADPRATVLVDRWEEDWGRLAFVELACRGVLLEPDTPGHTEGVRALRNRYPQYATQALEARPLLRLRVTRAATWTATGRP